MTIALIDNKKPQETLNQLDPILLDENKNLRLLSFEDCNQIPWVDLRVWMHFRGVYFFPTKEFVEWALNEINPKITIEIGAGNGYVANLLGIKAVDSKAQADPKFAAIYASMGQPTIQYPRHVLQYEAFEAVRKYQPHTVLTCWVSQKVYKTEPTSTPGAMFGCEYVREVLPKVRRLIRVVNDAQHGQDKINAVPHKEYRFPWLLSRSEDRKMDAIKIWKGTMK